MMRAFSKKPKDHPCTWSSRLSFPMLLLLVVLLPACAAADRETAQAGTQPGADGEQWQARAAVVPAQWQNLRQQLAADGLAGPKVDALLAALGERTQDPMGRKMVELYRKTFLPKPAKAAKEDKDAVYKGVVTAANASLCRQYIADHEQAFVRARAEYAVPQSIAAALLFVETRLGRVLQDVPENALHTLASMSQSATLGSIEQWHAKMPGYEKHEDWFAGIMPKRAAWAYRETSALIRYMLANGLDAERLPGSIYGAIGLCQFMPSNIDTYAVDGDGDGVIDLYVPDDAVMSLANYLHKHGWKEGLTRDERHRILMRYNKSRKYANTILALAALVEKQDKTPAPQ